MSEPILVREEEAAELLTLRDSIEALEEIHRQYAAGAATNMVKTQAQVGPANLHAIGGVIGGSEVAGTKTWMHTPGGAHPLLILFSPTDGSIIALVEAFALGQRRTAATAALATRLLSNDDSEALALLGTGKQAVAQAEAVAAVRPIATISVWGRDAGRRKACVERLAKRVDAEVRDVDELPAAVAGADVITLITRATEPFLAGAELPEGVHVNGVGAILPGRREVDVETVARSAVVAVDSKSQAQANSAELRKAEEEGSLDWDQVAELGQIVSGQVRGRGAPEEITFFKALGVGIADVALGAEVLRRARGADAGQPLHPRVVEEFESSNQVPTG